MKRIIDRDGYTLLDPVEVPMAHTQRTNGRGTSWATHFWVGVAEKTGELRLCPNGGDIHGITLCDATAPAALLAINDIADLAKHYRFQRLREQFPNLEEPPIAVRA